MKQPGDTGVQGVPIAELDVNAEMSSQGAAATARDLIEECRRNYEAYYSPESGLQIDRAFVTKAIDFREGDVFMLVNEDGENQTFRVVSDHNWCRGLEIAPPAAQPGTQEYERGTAWEQVASYGTLWLAWLQGRVVELRERVTYVRVDTGEELADVC